MKTRNITRDKDRHLIMTEESLYQENIHITNVYTCNNKALEYVKQN